MKPILISRVVKHFLRTGVIDPNLLPDKERFFAEVNSIIFKNIVLHRINDLVKKIDSTDILNLRINILENVLRGN